MGEFWEYKYVNTDSMDLLNIRVIARTWLSRYTCYDLSQHFASNVTSSGSLNGTWRVAARQDVRLHDLDCGYLELY